MLAALLSIVLAGCGSDTVSSVPDRPSSGNVLDQAHLLSQDEVTRLNETIEEGNRISQVRIAVITVEGADGSWENWTKRVATDWAVGEAGKDNGILVAVDTGSRKTRIEVADGARDKVSDKAAAAIDDDVLIPKLKDKQYFIALNGTVSGLYQRAEGMPGPASRETHWWDAPLAILLGGLIGAAVFVPPVRWLRRRRLLSTASSDKRLPDGGAAARAEIEEFERQHPGVRVSGQTRASYLRYRSHYQTRPEDPALVAAEPGPRNSSNPVDQERAPAEKETLYAATFLVWLALYQQHPALYGGYGSPAAGIHASYAPAVGSWGGSGGGSSFGGGGGFSGGGASGSF